MHNSAHDYFVSCQGCMLRPHHLFALVHAAIIPELLDQVFRDNDMLALE